jgi:prepilin-type N-terminal cleavage/methylation domain-containing protein
MRVKRPGGFTLIELLVVICVVAVLFGVALDRLLKYQELAERTAVEQNLAAINVALTMKFAALVAAGRAAEIEAVAGTNPAGVLERMPENYLGELQAPDVASLPRGSWHFDLRSRDFVYVPSRARYLSSERGAPIGNLRFRVMLTAGADPGGLRVLRQPYIGAVTPYRWAVD